jgi:integrase
MSTKIGIKQVLAMQPGTIIWDDKVRGFNARRQKSETVTFSVFYRTLGGKQRWHRIGRFGVWSPDQARKEAQRMLRARDLGEDPSGARMAVRNSPTFAQLLDEYVAEMAAHRIDGKKASTIKSDISRIATHIKPMLGKHKVASVTRSDMEAFMHQLSPGSQGRIIGLTSGIFTYAIKKGLLKTNPCHGIKMPKDRKRLRRLSISEYPQLWSALQDEKHVTSDIFLFLALSGWRSGEARLLKFSELDLVRRVATLSDSKTGQSVRPVSMAAIEIIQKQPRNGEYVFALPKGAPISNLTPYWRKLRMPKDVTPHSLRHSLASLAADMGLADHTISGLLGHSGRGVTSRHLHLGDKALLEASDLVANATLKLMRPISTN